MKIRPLHNQVIVKRKEADERIAGGLLFAPATAQEKPLSGEVLAVGPGKYLNNGELVPLDVKVGDVVLFTKFSNSEIKVDGEEYLIMKEDAILAVLNNES